MFFYTPIFLLLIPACITAVYFAGLSKKAAGFKFSSASLVQGLKPSLKVIASGKLIYIRLAAAIFIALALSRPVSPTAESTIETEGIDIALAIDSSTSMLAEDFIYSGKRVSRIDVVKDVVREFIGARKNDRIAIVTFAARPYTICPLTLDYGWLLDNLERIKSGMVEDGTAIGSGIASSVNRLKNSSANSKIVILLTDGRNNAGKISPVTAAEAAKALKIKIYTIGAGSKGPVPYPVRDMWGNKVYQQAEVDIDEDTLTRIADITAAKYFRATDTESLRRIYAEIDKMEKTKIEEKGYREYNELFPFFLIPGLILLLAEIILSNTVLRKLP
ncbi:MAG: VWA domain-containing protein [Candidatus Omnitrophica bacterium]|nr:VWA domain-containing protein [Candidatus Omnitrophota bacterium]